VDGVMDFSWSPDQQARYDEILAAVREAFPFDERGYSREDWKTLGRLGVLGASVPTAYGGRGGSALDAAAVFEAAGRGCADTGLVFAAAAHLFACVMPIAEFADESLRRSLLPRMSAGELVAGNAATESDAGSDLSHLGTEATKVDGGFLLNGTKSFVSNGPEADVYVTYATTDRAAGHLGITGFVVDRATAGVNAGPPMEKMGLRSCPAGTVTFDDCFVPDERVLGPVGGGTAVFRHSMIWERTCLFALYLGVQQRLLDRCVAHVRQRRQFGRRLGYFQSVANRVVDMKLRLDSGRLLLHRACWQWDRGEDAGLATALAKLAVSEAAVASAQDAIQLFGARGYLHGEGIEAALRDAVPATIFSGTSEIQRTIVAKELGL
jgi:alkylation response protein AidB-like acyl-CoA dehydrogenase